MKIWEMAKKSVNMFHILQFNKLCRKRTGFKKAN